MRAFGAPADTTADAVVGQTGFTGGAANQGGAVGTAATLNGNRGIFISPTDGRLWVADTSNNRVLSWSSPDAFTNGANADLVLGQADFAGILANRSNNMADPPAANTLSGPRSVCVDSAGRVYVADSDNKRILRYDPPITNGMAAVQVFGQAGSFTTATQNNGGTSNTSLGNPDGIGVDKSDNIYLADRNLHRVMIFNTPAAGAGDVTADLVLGQPDFASSTNNQGGANPAANTLAFPIAVFVDKDGNVYVSDEGNNRVLQFKPPLANNMNASKVFGQPNFTTGGTNTGGRSASSMFGPVGAAVDPVTARLYVCDPINMRILEFNDPLTGDAVADRVFGQLGDFTTGDPNKGGISANTLNDVAGVAVDAKGNMYGSDRLNSRLLRFNAPPPSQDPNNTTQDPGMPGQEMSTGQFCGLCCPGVTMMMPLSIAGVLALRRIRRKRRR